MEGVDGLHGFASVSVDVVCDILSGAEFGEEGVLLRGVFEIVSVDIAGGGEVAFFVAVGEEFVEEDLEVHDSCLAGDSSAWSDILSESCEGSGEGDLVDAFLLLDGGVEVLVEFFNIGNGVVADIFFECVWREDGGGAGGSIRGSIEEDNSMIPGADGRE